MRKLMILSALLTLTAGLWAENPQGSPAGPIVYNGLHFQLVDNEHVKLVKYVDAEPVPYKGDIVVPDQFEFTDTQGKVYTLTVIWIGDNAFADSPELTSVTLPATITNIGDKAFANSENLESVTCLGTEPATLETEVFANPAIYVPRGTVDTYKEQWSAYADLISLSPLDQAKVDAIAAVNDVADAAKAAIDDASTYPAAKDRQNYYKNLIDATVNTATNVINNATKIEDVGREREQYASIINEKRAEALAEIANINKAEDLKKYKVDAILEIRAASEGIQNTEMNNWIRDAFVEIPDAATIEEVDRIKNQILPMIQLFQDGKAEGDAAGYQRAQDELPTDPEGTAGHTVTITKGDKTLILVNPDKVTYGKQE